MSEDKKTQINEGKTETPKAVTKTGDATRGKTEAPKAVSRFITNGKTETPKAVIKPTTEKKK